MKVILSMDVITNNGVINEIIGRITCPPIPNKKDALVYNGKTYYVDLVIHDFDKDEIRLVVH